MMLGGDGARLTYRKTLYTWTPALPVPVPNSLDFRGLTAARESELVQVVQQVLVSSSDPSDMADIRRDGDDAASRLLASAHDCFEFEAHWWALAYDTSGVLVGFVLPALFKDVEPGNREGSLFHVGTVLAARGKGFGTALLAQGTQTLATQRVSRIVCDTWEQNAPMRAAFQRCGYIEGQVREVVL